MLYIIDNETNTLSMTLETNNKEKWYKMEGYTILEGSPYLEYDEKTKSLVKKEKQAESLEPDTAIISKFKVPDFGLFIAIMSQSPLWAFLIGISSYSLKLQTGFTMVLTSITATRSVEGLKQSMTFLRGVMQDSSKVSDFSDEQLLFINNAFIQCNIDIILTSETMPSGFPVEESETPEVSDISEEEEQDISEPVVEEEQEISEPVIEEEVEVEVEDPIIDVQLDPEVEVDPIAEDEVEVDPISEDLIMDGGTL